MTDEARSITIELLTETDRAEAVSTAEDAHALTLVGKLPHSFVFYTLADCRNQLANLVI